MTEPNSGEQRIADREERRRRSRRRIFRYQIEGGAIAILWAILAVVAAEALLRCSLRSSLSLCWRSRPFAAAWMR